MAEETTEYIRDVAQSFDIDGRIAEISPYGEGHINRTYLVVTDKNKYVLQKMNTHVFTDPEGVMRNICGVTEYLRARGAETLTVIPTRDGKPLLYSDGCWRMYEFISGTVTLQSVSSGEMFKSVGSAFGEFQSLLAEYPADTLAETIPHFHDTPRRYENFVRAEKADVKGRAAEVGRELEFIHARKAKLSAITDAIALGSVPVRVTHNDTKLNNILLDEKTLKPRAVIDLDTVMGGSLLYDYGDSIRFGAATAAEDERDLDKMHFSLPMYTAFTQGFCAQAASRMTDAEKALLPVGAFMMTIECGMRFLTDYLEGDTYFGIKYPEHNLVRARTQFKLVYEMERLADEMRAVAERCCKTKK